MRFTVVIPLFNKRESIAATLESVFAQTFQPEEVIVVNDGSTDGSEKIVKSLNNPLIKLINQSNGGASAARNRGIKKANGEWIAFLDADDIWMPQFLEKMKMLSDIFPECKVLASAYFIQNQTGLRKNILLNRLPFPGEYGKLRNYFEVSESSHPPICSSSVVTKGEAIKSIGGFPENVKSGEDLVTWAKLAAEFEIAYTKEPMSVFIVNNKNTYNGTPSRIPQNPDYVGDELITIYRKNKGIPGIRRYVSLWFKMRSSIYLRLGMRKESLIESCKSLVLNPLNIKVYAYLLILVLPASFTIKLFRKLGNS